MASERSSYKNHPLLVLLKEGEESTGGKFKPFQFGVNKAKLILMHIEDIKQFVLDNDKGQDQTAE